MLSHPIGVLLDVVITVQLIALGSCQVAVKKEPSQNGGSFYPHIWHNTTKNHRMWWFLGDRPGT